MDGVSGMGGRPHPPPVPARRVPMPAPIGARYIRIWLVLVVSAIVVGTAGFILIERWAFVDALYLTVITLTSVGLGTQPADAAGKLWTLVIAVAGVGLIFGFVGVVAEYLIDEVSSGKREARQMAREVEALQGHYVLCGYGRVGSMVGRELRHEGERLAVIDILPESLDRARRDSFLVVEGDATADATLRAAGVERAKGLITTVDSDATNVYVILSARALNPKLFVVARANAAGAEARLTQAGADRVVSPYTMAGRRIAGLALRPRVVDYIDAALSHGELSFALEEVGVVAGDSLEGRTVSELRDRGIFTLAIVRDDDTYDANPARDRRIVAGETLIVSGSAQTMAELRGG
jgi:voltage-gated potassium channel